MINARVQIPRRGRCYSWAKGHAASDLRSLCVRAICYEKSAQRVAVHPRTVMNTTSSSSRNVRSVMGRTTCRSIAPIYSARPTWAATTAPNWGNSCGTVRSFRGPPSAALFDKRQYSSNLGCGQQHRPSASALRRRMLRAVNCTAHR